MKSKYKSLKEFKEKQPEAHKDAKSQGLIPELCEMFGWRYPRTEWRPHEEAREYARSLRLTSSKEWRNHVKNNGIPADIPVSPINAYGKDKGWVSWPNFLGYEITLKTHLTLDEAMLIAKDNHIKTFKAWVSLIKNNKNIGAPIAMDRLYKDKGWISWTHFLGNEENNYKIDITLTEIIDFLNDNDIRTRKQWLKYFGNNKKTSILSKGFASTPKFKKLGWTTWGEMFPSRQWVLFKEARKFAHSKKWVNVQAWKDYAKEGNLPKNIPNNPYAAYKNEGWVSWPDFLNNDNLHNSSEGYYTYEELYAFIRTLPFKFKSGKEWMRYWKENRPTKITRFPYRVYKDKGWVSWPELLGSEPITKKNYWTEEKCIEFVETCETIGDLNKKRSVVKALKRYNKLAEVKDKLKNKIL